MAIQRRLIESVEVTDNLVHVIRLKDIFDASTVNEFEKVVSYLLAKNFYKIVVDLGRVEFISSAGWGAFTAELRRARENQGDVKLANMTPDVYDVFLLLELDSFIQSYDTTDEAIAAFLQPVAAAPPAPSYPSILQEIKAAARFREIAEAGERKMAEASDSGLGETASRRLTAEQQSYPVHQFAATDEKEKVAAAPAVERHAGGPVDYNIDKIAPASTEDAVFKSPEHVNEQFEFSGDRAVRSEKEEAAASPQEVIGGHGGYTIDNDTVPIVYNDSASGAYGEYGADTQEEYAVDSDATEFGHEGSPAGFYDEYDAAEQEEYISDSETAESGYAGSAVQPEDAYGAVEDETYSGDRVADEFGYEGSDAESYNEYGAIVPEEFAGDGETAGFGYVDSSAETDEYGTAEDEAYTGDGAAEFGDEGSVAEFDGEYTANEQETYAGEFENGFHAAESYVEDGYAEQEEHAAGEDDTGAVGYENSSSASYNEYGMIAPAEYTGDLTAEDFEYENPAVDSSGFDFESQDDDIISGEVDESGSDDSSLPLPAASGPEMWELILASEKSSVDPYMFEKAEHGDATHGHFASETSPAGADDDLSGHKTGNAGGLFTAFGAAPGFVSNGDAPDSGRGAKGFSASISTADPQFSGHVPIAEDSSQTGVFPELASGAETDFPAAYGNTASKLGADDRFDEFETQDIRDPWILDEIDTLPEEYEMEDGAAEEEESPITASELLAYDLEMDELPPLLSEQAQPQETAMEEIEAPEAMPAQTEGPFLAGAADLEMTYLDSPERNDEELTPNEPAFAPPAEAHDALPHENDEIEFAAPFSSGDDVAVPRGESFEAPVESETPPRAKKQKAKKSKARKGAQTKKAGSKKRNEVPSLSDDQEEPLAPSLETENQFTTAADSANMPFAKYAGEAALSEPGLAAVEDNATLQAIPEQFGDETAAGEPALAVFDDNATSQTLPEPLDEEAVPYEPELPATREEPAFLDSKGFADDFPALPLHEENDELTSSAPENLLSHPQNGNGESAYHEIPNDTLQKIPASGDVDEIIRAVVVTHPDFGPAMICKFIEDRFEPPLSISRSAVYRFLRDANLNTREKRQEYADQLFDPSELAEEI